MHTQNILADKSFALQVLMWSQEKGLDEVEDLFPVLELASSNFNPLLMSGGGQIGEHKKQGRRPERSNHKR